MADLSAYFVYGVALLGVVFVIEAVYALFFRNFGLVNFKLVVDIPGADTKTVWDTYFDPRNDWNSVTERLSYEVISETPRIIRSLARQRGSDDEPVASEFKVETLEPERVRRATVLKVDGLDVPAAEQACETFAVSQGPSGVQLTVDAAIPVRGWLWTAVHRRILARIYEDLRMACLRRAGVPFEAYERRWWFWTVKRS